ncbi:restriction endonuclease [Streptomyces sp. NBC_00847]|uniref:restriction endonuclease n=1 Tax=Streptomyces sp. NBC_00847 TaxID=2975850 RepID=UPI00225E6AA9|nr:restriction endonuclease [Streptomyces sp. NBC_00847]MCX4885878.1 restriction endonuclease [Streptomyces sp. NBC_00847]
MTYTQPAPRRTRKTSTRRRTLRLPQLGWGWLGVTLALFVIAKTWPIYTGLAVALIAVGFIVAARRPAWLQRAAHRLPAIDFHRPSIPNRGRRTLDAFQRMTPARFEQAIAELALEDPYVHSAQAVGQANDRGMDVLVHLNDGRRILVQCKKYRHGNNVGSETIQTINGVYRDIHGCHQAVIVTTAKFTGSAKDTNARLPYPIRLIDGTALTAWANGGTPPWT